MKVIKGPLKNLLGRVELVEGDNITVMPDLKVTTALIILLSSST